VLQGSIDTVSERETVLDDDSLKVADVDRDNDPLQEDVLESLLESLVDVVRDSVVDDVSVAVAENDALLDGVRDNETEFVREIVCA
jgi:hypothetical protein